MATSLISREKLDTSYYQSIKLFDLLTNIGGIFKYILDNNSVLKGSYNIVHNLSEALHKNDSDAFLRLLAHAKLAELPIGLRRELSPFIKSQSLIGNTLIVHN